MEGKEHIIRGMTIFGFYGIRLMVPLLAISCSPSFSHKRVTQPVVTNTDGSSPSVSTTTDSGVGTARAASSSSPMKLRVVALRQRFVTGITFVARVLDSMAAIGDQDVTSKAILASSDDSIVKPLGGNSFQTLGAGKSTISAVIGTCSASLELEVISPWSGVLAVNASHTMAYHSPQSPGFTEWCETTLTPDGRVLVGFMQVTGPIERASRFPPDALALFNRIYPGAGYDFSGLDNEGLTLVWNPLTASAQSAMPGATFGMNHPPFVSVALLDGTLIRLAWGQYFGVSSSMPQTGFLQRSLDNGQTWGDPVSLLSADQYTSFPKRLRVLRDGRLLVLGGYMPVSADYYHKTSLADMSLFFGVSNDGGQTWEMHTSVGASNPDMTEEWDAVELPNGDLFALMRIGDK